METPNAMARASNSDSARSPFAPSTIEKTAHAPTRRRAGLEQHGVAIADSDVLHLTTVP